VSSFEAPRRLTYSPVSQQVADQLLMKSSEHIY